MKTKVHIFEQIWNIKINKVREFKKRIIHNIRTLIRKFNNYVKIVGQCQSEA